jgi:hypothetical protein
MPSSQMLRHEALVRTDVSEDLSTSIFTVTRIGKLVTTLAETSNQLRLRRNTAQQPRRRHSSNEYLIKDEIKRRLNSGNACFRSVQNILSSLLLSKS